MVGLISALIKKFPNIVPTKLDFDKKSTINLEATALSFIITTLIISCLYNPNDYSANTSGKTKFSFFLWFKQMQNRLTQIKNDIVGMYVKYYNL